MDKASTGFTLACEFRGKNYNFAFDHSRPFRLFEAKIQISNFIEIITLSRFEAMKVGVIWKGVGELANQLIGVSSHQEHLQPILNYLKAANHVFRLVPYLPVLNGIMINRN